VSGLSWLALVALFGWLLTSRRPTGRLIAWRTLLAGGFVLVTLISLGIVSGGMHGDALMRSNRLGFAPSESRRSVRQWPADERALDVSSAAP
jgi:hypothetical protein